MVSPRDTIYVFILFYWTTIALQYCVSFCCTASWISYMYTHILSLLSLPPILHSTLLGLHRAGSEALFADSSFPLAVYLTQVVSVRGEGNGTPLQYSCLENPMDGRAWRAAVHGVAEGRAWLSDFPFTFHFHALEKEMATHSSVLAWRISGTGAWWAAVYGVAQSLTWLKWLSSSSSSSVCKSVLLSQSVPHLPPATCPQLCSLQLCLSLFPVCLELSIIWFHAK